MDSKTKENPKRCSLILSLVVLSVLFQIFAIFYTAICVWFWFCIIFALYFINHLLILLYYTNCMRRTFHLSLQFQLISGILSVAGAGIIGFFAIMQASLREISRPNDDLVIALAYVLWVTQAYSFIVQILVVRDVEKRLEKNWNEKHEINSENYRQLA